MRNFMILLVTLLGVGLAACGGDSVGGGPAGVYKIDKAHLEALAHAEAAKSMPEGMEMPAQIMDMIKQSMAKVNITINLNDGGTWTVTGTSGDGDTLDESGTWTASGGTVTFTTTKKKGKDHTETKTAKYSDGVILIAPDSDGPEMRFVRS